MSGPSSKALSAFLQRVKSYKGFDKHLEKVKLISAGDGEVKAELKIENEHTNFMGGLHGGFSATLVDIISTWALLTHKYGAKDSVSVNMNMTYLQGAKTGDDIIIDAKTLKTGKSLAFLEVEIRNKATSKLLVKGSHTKYFLEPKTPK